MLWVVALLAAVPAVLVSCTGSSGGGGRDVAPGRADVRSLLNDLTHAVRTHDRHAFAAALDTVPAASAYRARQLTAFATLARLPLRLWRYDLVGLIADPTARSVVSARYGAPATLVHVTLSYALRGYDDVPDRHDLYLTVVRHGGHPVIAGDDAGQNESLTSWKAPWDYGPLVDARGARSLVLGPPGTALDPLAADVDAAITAVTAVWGGAWSQRVVAIVAPNEPAFDALSGAGTDAGAATQAVAVTTGIDPLSGRPYGQRLLLDPAQLQRLSRVGLHIVLTHEITHLATAVDTADITPRWLVEGFAEYVANRGSGQPVAVAAAELVRQVRSGRLPVALPGPTAFAGTGAAAAYEQAWLACRYLAARVGQGGLVRFYRDIGRALEPSAEAVAGAFTSVLHESQQRFTAQWRTWLREQLR